MAFAQFDSWTESTPVELTSEDRLELKKLDSQSFGRINFSQHPEGSRLKFIIQKGLSELENILREEFQKGGNENYSKDVYCKLGHYNLLLERFPQALSAYQKFFELEPDYWKSSAFLYGIAIVYFHYNSYQWAVRAFQQVLYIDKGFACTKDVHLNLALIFKTTKDFNSSKKHFELAGKENSSSLVSDIEVKFHLAHIEELTGNYIAAKSEYEDALNYADLPIRLKALLLKQLGWLHETVEELGEVGVRLTRAVEYYQQSILCVPDDGEVYYYLGRCNAALGDVQAAFGYYRSAIDKRESCPDTWCSIGVLYQQQGQPCDALQAFICAVQLDETHVSAWYNLGILYESESQPKDALVCFENVLKHCKGPINSALETRIDSVRTIVTAHPNFESHNRRLHSIDEAWDLPIPAELTSRRQGKSFSKRGMGEEGESQAKRMRPGGAFIPTGGPAVVEEMFPPDQYDLMRRLEHQLQITGALPPPQQMKLMSLQQQFQSMVARNTKRMAAVASGLPVHPPQMMDPFGRVGPGGMPHPWPSPNNFSLGNGFPSPQVPSTTISGGGHAPTMDFSPAKVASPKNAPPSTEVAPAPALQEPTGDSSGNTQSPAPVQPDNQGEETPKAGEISLDLTDTLNVLTSMIDKDSSTTVKKEPSSSNSPSNQECESGNENLPNASQAADSQNPTPEAMKTLQDSDAMKRAESLMDAFLTPSKLLACENTAEEKPLSERLPESISVLPTDEGLRMIRKLGTDDIDEMEILKSKVPPPLPPKAPVDTLPKDKLYPPTPTVTVESKREAFSEKLQKFCLSPEQPVTVIRGLATALKMDFGLFTTRTLCECNPDHAVEVRHQLQQPTDENWSSDSEYQTWLCESARSKSTVLKYAKYQASFFLQAQQESRQGGGQNSGSDNSAQSSDDGDQLSSNPLFRSSRSNRRRKKLKPIQFGTNVDLSDEKKWGPQLQEITKLPLFTRLVSGSNMLSHVQHTILGMNSCQLYMKVPGCRTPGHQENLNFASVNVNIGPGDCEWFAVHNDYWGVMHRLCEKNNTNFLTGSWWPLLEDLYEASVPVYRFIQRPGDLVWVNSGAVHWVQSTGFCNNIAWNVGPLTMNQYSLCAERYEWNKLQNYKSLVPMITLSWNLARNVRIADENLYYAIKLVLVKSLKYCEMLIEQLKSQALDVKWHGRQHSEPVNYCATCEEEVFNVLFTREDNKKWHVYCRGCAHRISSCLQGFVILQEYKTDELRCTLHHFRPFVKDPSGQNQIRAG